MSKLLPRSFINILNTFPEAPVAPLGTKNKKGHSLSDAAASTQSCREQAYNSRTVRVVFGESCEACYPSED